MDNVTTTKVLNPENKLCELGLYIHIPFCVKKCDYCDFLSTAAGEDKKKKYVDALLTEINSYQGSLKDYRVSSIFIGGGTPSCINESYIVRIIAAVHKVFQVDTQQLEATIEVNPGTVNKAMLQAYLDAGINRLSFGLQSANNRELQLLGRIHSYEQFQENYELARALGFHNINIDLMSALPGQTVETWENTLHTAAGLQPEHISAYSLIIEEGTKFYERYHEGASCSKELPGEEADRLIYHKTKEILEQYGYHRYEISNYAKKGFECRHNTSYWIGTQYLGIGLGSASLLQGKRFSNTRDMSKYIENPLRIREDANQLTDKDKMEEFMFLGLRLTRGIHKSEFSHRFGVEIEAIYGDQLEKLKQMKLLEMNEDIIKLTEYGIDISNTVLATFLL